MGATTEGQALFESLGFAEIASVHEGKRKGYLLQDVRNPVRLINLFLKNIDKSEQATRSP
jgi:hypothetical protein